MLENTLVSTLLALLIPATAGAQELVEAELSSESLSVLEGRFSMNVLEGGELEARGHSIMAAAPANTVESRIRIDAGDERMVIMAYELFAGCGESFGSVATSFLAPLEDAAVVHPVAEAGGTEYVLYTPAERDLTTEAVHVGTAFVCASDRHVIRLDFLVNPAGTEDMPALEGRVTQMLGSLSAGDRALNVGERTVDMGAPLELPVPEGIYHYTQSGPDFTVNYLGQVTPLGEPAGTVLFYIGGHPTRRHSNDPNVLSTLFGNEALWSVEERNGRSSQEALVPHPTEEFTIIHILISGEDQPMASELRTIVEGIRTQ